MAASEHVKHTGTILLCWHVSTFIYHVYALMRWHNNIEMSLCGDMPGHCN